MNWEIAARDLIAAARKNMRGERTVMKGVSPDWLLGLAMEALCKGGALDHLKPRR